MCREKWFRHIHQWNSHDGLNGNLDKNFLVPSRSLQLSLQVHLSNSTTAYKNLWKKLQDIFLPNFFQTTMKKGETPSKKEKWFSTKLFIPWTQRMREKYKKNWKFGKRIFLSHFVGRRKTGYPTNWRRLFYVRGKMDF